MYQLTSNGFIERNSDGAFIPPDVRNCDYQAYQRWLVDGNKPQPVAVPDPAEVAKAEANAAAQESARAAMKTDPVLIELTKLTPQGVYDLVLKADDAKARQVLAALAMAQVARAL